MFFFSTDEDDTEEEIKEEIKYEEIKPENKAEQNDQVKAQVSTKQGIIVRYPYPMIFLVSCLMKSCCE